jgi:hypothetical protein
VTKPQQVAPAFLLWPDARELAEDYARGVSLAKLAKAYPYPYNHIKAYLQHLGVWRTRSDQAKMRAAREKARRQAAFSAFDPWGLDEFDFPLHVASPKSWKFIPMLTVDIASGNVLLNRIREATRAFDRFECRRCEA